MQVLENAKRAFERVTGYGRPTRRGLAELVRIRKPHLLHFKDDGRTPNNHLPLVLYCSPISFRDGLDPAAVFEDLFAAHGWRQSRRDGKYDFLHFHRRTHEVLGIAQCRLRAEFGGSAGKTLELRAGDVVILPAGTGHRRLASSGDLLVVGAYPPSGTYDEPRPADVNHAKAASAIGRVRAPTQDPVYGKKGPLVRLWRSARRPAVRSAPGVDETGNAPSAFAGPHDR